MNTYHNSDLSFWIEWYTDNYKTGIFTLEHLEEKLIELESVEDEWKNNLYARSYYNSVKALKIVINKIKEEEKYETTRNYESTRVERLT